MEECAICLSNTSNLVFVLSNCRHFFHEGCLRTWVQSVRRRTGNFGTATCPTCRTPLDIEDMEYLTPSYRHFRIQGALQPTEPNSSFEIVVYEIFDPNNETTLLMRRERIRCDLGLARNLPRISDREYESRNRFARASRLLRENRRRDTINTNVANEELELLH